MLTVCGLAVIVSTIAGIAVVNLYKFGKTGRMPVIPEGNTDGFRAHPMTHVCDVIREWLGWCPQVPTPQRSLTVLNNEAASNAPSQGTGIPERTESLKRYRNQVLLWAVFFTLISIPFMVYFLTTDLTRLMLSFGTIAGLGVFAFFGRWLWNSLEMLEKGMTIKTGPGEYHYPVPYCRCNPVEYCFDHRDIDYNHLVCRDMGVPRVCHGIYPHSLVRVHPDPVVGAKDGMPSDV